MPIGRTNRMSRWVIAIVTAGVLGTAVGSAAEADQAIDIIDDAYTSTAMTVRVGERVTWVNQGWRAHTVTIDSPSLDSGSIGGRQGGGYGGGGGSYGGGYGGGSGGGSYGDGMTVVNYFWAQFNQPGSYNYHCRFHPNMRGTVTVQ